jgi:hypothetical protein
MVHDKITNENPVLYYFEGETFFFKKKDNFTNPPQTLPTFADTPLTFKNSHLPSLNIQKFSLTPVQIRAQI